MEFPRSDVDRRVLLLKKAGDIPNKKALDIILGSFPAAERAELLATIKPKLRFKVD